MSLTSDEDVEYSSERYIGKYRVASTETEFTLSPTGVSIFSFTGKGILESMILEVEDSVTDLELLIDGVQNFKFNLDHIDSLGINDKPSNGPFSLASGGKTIHFFPRNPIYFSTSFEFKGYHAGSKKIRGYLITYLEE